MRERLAAVRSFTTTHARLLNRRRFELLFDGAGPEPALAALRAYRNPDGGYGRGLKSDLRARESLPAALHAFEVFEEIAPETAPEAAEQSEDGGWTVDFQSYSPAAALEWRGYATVRALSVLRANGAR